MGAGLVNAWLWAAVALLVMLPACLWVCMRHSALDALVALELASTITTLVLLALAQGYRRDPFMDLALVSALLSFAGALTFARFLERWV
jgi:multisubunit Na+/H+ antiporter MnhF subunit